MIYAHYNNSGTLKVFTASEGHFHPILQKLKIREYKQIFRKWCNPNDVILNTDLYDSALESNNTEIFHERLISIDIDFNTVSKARDNLQSKLSNSQTVLQSCMSRLPFQENTFDSVFSPSTLDHLPVKIVPDALNECYRILKPGGRLILILDSRENYLHHLSIKLQQKLRLLPFHVEKTYSFREVQNLARRTGFLYQSGTTIMNSPELLNFIACRLPEPVSYSFVKVSSGLWNMFTRIICTSFFREKNHEQIHHFGMFIACILVKPFK